jgi:fumarate hydratase, class I
VVAIDLNQPMDAIRAELSKHPVKTRVSLTGTIVVARDLAHAKIKEAIDKGEPMPQYLKDYAVYYAGPAKTPEGYASGSFGPTTAGRMDSYVGYFQERGGSFVMLAKGNRSQSVTDACKITAVSILDQSADRQHALLKIALRRLKFSTSKSSAWKRSGRSTLLISQHLSLSMTRAMISSPRPQSR